MFLSKINRFLSVLLTIAFVLTAVSCAEADKAMTSSELFDLGEKYLLEMDYEQAVVQFLKIIEVEPKNADAYIKAAEAYEKLGKTDEAIAILERGFSETGDERLTKKRDELVSKTETTTETEAVTETSAVVVEELDKEAVSDVIMTNLDSVKSGNMSGFKLVDLDFDGMPELIVSHIFTYRYQVEIDGTYYDREETLVDADVYRIRNDSLVYIDTLYNVSTLVYDNGNILGLKTTADGNKAWFNISYKNRITDELTAVEYLFTLDGDELNFTEVFREDKDPLGDWENSTYYYFEKPLAIEVKEHKEVCIDCTCDPETEPFYSDFYACLYYKDFYVDVSLEVGFGKSILYGLFKAEWCADMSKSVVKLYSDELMSARDDNDNTTEHLYEEEFNNIIVNAIEDFYNDNVFTEFEYNFLGAFAKPVIYLYPEETTDINVTVDFPNGGDFTCTYPGYGDGWNVTASPDGTLINRADGREYSYLYWEGVGSAKWDFSSGFVVKGIDTAAFLQDKLAYLGLKPREYNEFIVYWLPLMQENPYNLITFQTDVYEENTRLNISPEPDSIQRIFMAYAPLEKAIDIPEQQLDSFERTGFSVIEWGGTCVIR